MPFNPQQHTAEGDFVDDAFGIAHQAVSQAVVVAAKKTNAERIYAGFPRMWRVRNRAELGALAGKPWFFTFNGQRYPDGVDAEDESTWLKPGETMIVDREAIIHAFGDFLNPTLPDRELIIQKYGDWEFDVQPTIDGKVAGRVPVKTIIGPPVAFPDLILEPMDMRGNNTKKTKIAILELYTKKQAYTKPQMVIVDVDGKPLEQRRKDLIQI